MKRTEKEYHEEYYAGLGSVPDERLQVQTEGFWEALDQNPIGDLYRCLLDKMGDPKGAFILDYGCGSGQIGVFFARLGARVRGFDVSERAVALANRRAAVNGVQDRASFQAMDSRSLAYRTGIFDVIVGRWVLHHLEKSELTVCAQEMARVLKRGGKAFFIEPLGDNCLIEFVRRHPSWYARAEAYRSDRESTMRRTDILLMGSAFRNVFIHEFHLLAMLKRVIGSRKVRDVLKAADAALFLVFPSLKRYCGECVIEFWK